MDLTTEEHKRDVFTVWDCLGQVGGLYGILCPLGAVIVYVCNFLIGSSLDTRVKPTARRHAVMYD